MAADSAQVTSAERRRAAFLTNGYACVPSLVDRTEASRLRSIFVRLHESVAGITSADRSDLIGDRNRTGTVTQLTHLERYTTELLDSPIRERAYSIARELLGSEARLDCETMIVKVAGSPDATPWHQDEAFWPPDFSREAITIWVPLQDVSPEAGCMQFLPGSHAGAVLAHRPIDDVEEPNGFEIVDVDSTFRVICPLPAGGATIHHSRTAHYTGPNLTGVARYSYVLTFSGRRVPVEPQVYRWQGERGRDRRRRAAWAGASGFVNLALYKASIVVARLNAINDRRNWNSRR